MNNHLLDDSSKPWSSQACFISGFLLRYFSAKSSGTRLKGQDRFTQEIQILVKRNVKPKIIAIKERPKRTSRIINFNFSMILHIISGSLSKQ